MVFSTYTKFLWNSLSRFTHLLLCQESFTYIESVIKTLPKQYLLLQGVIRSGKENRHLSAESMWLRIAVYTLFPNKCMKCDSDKPKKVEGKKQCLKQLQTFSSCQSIGDAAKLRNDEEMLLKIADQDVITRNLRCTQPVAKSTSEFAASNQL